MTVVAPEPASRPRSLPSPAPPKRKTGAPLALAAGLLALAAGLIFLAGVLRELQSLAPVEETFLCTLYYTPRESGFTPDKKFDLSPQTRPGLKGVLYPSDFLKAVALEGFGRIKNPVEGMAYIYYNGSWGYAAAPVGNRANALEAGTSCAISLKGGKIKAGSWILAVSPEMPKSFTRRLWRIDDAGAAVAKNQLDLYWGEDAPYGPGPDLQRPAGTEFAFQKEVQVCLVPSGGRLLRVWMWLTSIPIPAEFFGE